MAGALALAAGCADDGSGVIADSSLRVVNHSDYTIEEIYLTDIDNPDWGPNLLRGDVLYPDEELTLGVQCGRYDAKIIDEEGVPCTLHDLDLCDNDATWVIRNNTCTVFGGSTAPALPAVPAGAHAAPADAAASPAP